MRWVFFSLLIINALLFVWQLVAKPAPTAPVSVRAPATQEPTIVLLAEAETAGATGAAESPVADTTAAGDTASQQPLCTFIGPYEDRAAAEQLVERLAAMSVNASVEELEIPIGPGYWVYLEPRESHREALRTLSELQAQGIDSYVIPRGELENGISLGMFSKKDLADARLQELSARGIDAKLDIIERSTREVWVSSPVSASAVISDQGWQRLLEGAGGVVRKQNLCLHVASQDNFH